MCSASPQQGPVQGQLALFLLGGNLQVLAATSQECGAPAGYQDLPCHLLLLKRGRQVVYQEAVCALTGAIIEQLTQHLQSCSLGTEIVGRDAQRSDDRTNQGKLPPEYPRPLGTLGLWLPLT